MNRLAERESARAKVAPCRWCHMLYISWRRPLDKVVTGELGVWIYKVDGVEGKLANRPGAQGNPDRGAGSIHTLPVSLRHCDVTKFLCPGSYTA